MTDLSITAASVLKGSNAKTRRGTAGATITAGQVVYEDSSDGHSLKLADCDSSAATANPVGIALHGASDGQPLEYVYEDDSFTPGGTLVVGTIYVLSGTAGGIAPSTDLLAADYPVVLFVANTAALATMKIVRGTAVIPA